MITPQHRPTVFIFFTEKFITLKTGSGYRTARVDNAFEPKMMPLNCSPEQLGRSVQEVLSQSRFVHPDDDPELFHFRNADKRFDIWLEHIMDVYDYSSRTAVLKKLKRCLVRIYNKKIEVLTFKKTKLRWWDEIKEHQITLDLDATPVDLGKSVQKAMDLAELKE